jgi:hypothetical protein
VIVTIYFEIILVWYYWYRLVISSFLLYRSMFIAYFMAFVLSCETIGSIMFLGIEYKFFSAEIVVLCVLPRAPVVRTKSGSTFHPQL